ncbi:MAG: hypothetical protein ACTHZX_01425 [Microbacterium sp.]
MSFAILSTSSEATKHRSSAEIVEQNGREGVAQGELMLARRGVRRE